MLERVNCKMKWNNSGYFITLHSKPSHMKKTIFLLSIIFIQGFIFGQIAPNKYYVQFTDKNDSPYSIGNPSEYLSQRAIDRRTQQGIPIDEKDLPVNPAYIEGVAGTGAIILNPTKWLNGVTIYTDNPAVIDAIAQLPYVSSISKSSANLPQGNITSAVPYKSFFANEVYNAEPALRLKDGYAVGEFDYGASFNQIQMLHGDALHQMGYRGEGKVIAVLDAGYINANILSVFDSLWLNGQILGTRDFVEGGESSFDEHPHGSMVLSCMGGNTPGQLIGTAPKASYWLLRSEDGGSEYIIEEYNWVSAAEFADSVGADIINSSLGYTEFNDPLQNHTYSDLNGDTAPATIGADIAASRGILVVNSLGNEGSSSWYYLSVPSDGDSVMGIGAVNAGGQYAGFSSHGPSFDGRVKPDVAAQGASCYIVEPYSGAFTYGSGTSFSSPILAGMAACLWRANPGQTNMQIADAIRQSGSQYLDPDDLLGYGIPNFVEANNILTVIDGLDSRDLNLAVYPNPFSNEIRISMVSTKGQGSGIVTLSEMTGKIVISENIDFEIGSSQIVIPNLGNLHPGIYLITFRSDSGSVNAIALKR